MLARINLCLKHNFGPMVGRAAIKCMSNARPQDNTEVKTPYQKIEDVGGYAITQDNEVNVKDLDGKKIRPVDVNPWIQDDDDDDDEIKRPDEETSETVVKTETPAKQA